MRTNELTSVFILTRTIRALFEMSSCQTAGSSQNHHYSKEIYATTNTLLYSHPTFKQTKPGNFQVPLMDAVGGRTKGCYLMTPLD